jgi:hypothetical protein
MPAPKPTKTTITYDQIGLKQFIKDRMGEAGFKVKKIDFEITVLADALEPPVGAYEVSAVIELE